MKLRKFFNRHFLGIFIVSVSSFFEVIYLYNDYVIHGNWVFQRQLGGRAIFQYVTEIALFLFIAIGGLFSDIGRRMRLLEKSRVRGLHLMDEMGLKILKEPSFDRKIKMAVSFIKEYTESSKAALVLSEDDEFAFYYVDGFSVEDQQFIEREVLLKKYRREAAHNNGLLFEKMDMYDLTGYIILKPAKKITEETIESLKIYKKILLPFLRNARIVIALKNNKEEVEHLLGRYKLLHRFTADLQKASTVEEAYWKLVNIASIFFKTGSATMIDVSGVQNKWHFVAMKNTPGETLKIVEERIKRPDYGGNIKEVKTTKKVLYIEDTDKYPQWILTKNSPLSWVGIPIIVKGEVVAILNVDGKEKNGFTEKDLAFAQAFSDIASSIIGKINYMEKLNNYSITDSLTELYNKRELNNRMKEEINRAVRYNRKLSMVIFDLDRFKEWNDVYGHMEGDRLLAEIGKMIKSSIRNSDIPFRFGGDEFVVIFPETTAVEAFNVVETFSVRLSEIDWHKDRQIIFSAGVSEYKEGESAEQFINRADAALYEAKENDKEKIKIA